MSKRLHVLGICGIGMSGIGKMYAHRGYTVSGSDIVTPNDDLRKSFAKYGIDFTQGHDELDMTQYDILTHSSAVKAGSSVLMKAQEHSVKIWDRAEALTHIVDDYNNVIAVTGTHGKTTTSGMLYSIMSETHDCTLLNGGNMVREGTNAIIGKGDTIVLEADESDGTFLRLNCSTLVITNLDDDHTSYYGGFDEMVKIVLDSLQKKEYRMVVCGDDANLFNLAQKAVECITCGFDEVNDYIVRNVRVKPDGTFFDIFSREKNEYFLQDVHIMQYGDHNIRNALCAAIASMQVSTKNAIKDGLKKFAGVKRRLHILNEKYYNGDVVIIDDYAHHYRAVYYSLLYVNLWRANKGRAGRIISIIEPHKYSRFFDSMDKMIQSLLVSDVIMIFPVYEAGEKREDYKIADGVYADSDEFVRRAKKLHKDVYLVRDEKAMRVTLKDIAQDNDIVICMGAGKMSEYAMKLTKSDENIR